jgi:hypothetical protein
MYVDLFEFCLAVARRQAHGRRAPLDPALGHSTDIAARRIGASFTPS